MTNKKWIWALTVAGIAMTATAWAGDRVRVGVAIGRPVVHVHHRHAAGLHWGGFYATPRTVRVERVNYGSVDFNVEPQQSQIFVDGRYLGVADDFNGYPQTAKLPAGYHEVRAVAPDGRSIQRQIYVAAGEELNFNWKF